MTPNLLFLAATLLAALCSLSLLARSEALRGSGRVCGGLSTVLVAAAILLLTYSTGQLPAQYGVPAAILALTGLVTVASGTRKFIRRNISE